MPSVASDDILAAPSVEPQPAPRRRAPSPTSSTATLRRRSGRLERGQDRERPSRRGLRRHRRVLGGGNDVVAGRAVPRLSLLGLFRSGDAGRDVVISDAEGNVLATFPAQGWDIAWSPDSTRVAVWDVWPETIGVYGLDGARQRQLTMPSGWTNSGDDDPVWMPDGTSLSVRRPRGAARRRHAMAGRVARRGCPYSPDGSRVAYVDAIEVARSSSRRSTAPTLGRWWGLGFAAPVWSPTGDRFAFTYSEKNAGRSNELRVLDVATGEGDAAVRHGRIR